MARYLVAVFASAAIFAAPLSATAAASGDPVAGEIRSRFEDLERGGRLEVRGNEIATASVLADFYARRDYQRAWTSDTRTLELLALIGSAADHGLDPNDYLFDELEGLVSESKSSSDAALLADIDLLLTESLTRFGYHQRFGKVNPKALDPAWNVERRLNPASAPAETIQSAIDSQSLRAFFDVTLPRGPLYSELQAALAEYRSIQARGGWPSVTPGRTLGRGDVDPSVATLRMRLAITGDLPRGADRASTELDSVVERALITFQGRHGMLADGVLGPATRAALNVPVEPRIDQLRLSLERARWVSESVPTDYLVVNIAAFRVFLVRDRTIVWHARTMVGTPYRQTPVFRGDMTYLVFNPTWTVPPTILKEDILPKLVNGSAYLFEKKMSIIDAEGAVVDPAAIDWPSVLGGFPYSLRQEPGPANALGRVKFIFPNEHFIFLHDTPSRTLFDEPQRAFSSGCIRVEHPLELAERILDDPLRWDREAIDAVIASGKSQAVTLARPLPVFLLYWTASIDEQGRPRFLNDVYRRDAALLKALDGRFDFDLPAAS